MSAITEPISIVAAVPINSYSFESDFCATVLACEIFMPKFAEWFIPIALAFLISLLLFVNYLASHSVGRHAIALYPGQYDRVVMNSGEAVSTAMQAVHSASNVDALNVAIATVQRLADAGDAEAAFRLGRYYHRESPEPNYALALRYYEIASHNGHAWATNNLGLLYRNGLGVDRDDKKAYDYFAMASRQNNPWSYYNLADMTFRGRGVPADSAGGIAWLERGAASQCTLCLVEEAAVYHSGAYAVHPDTNKAVALLSKASTLGDPRATLIVAELYIVGDGVPQSSTKSSELLKDLSNRGDEEATNLLGELSADNKIRDYLFDHSLGGVRQIPTDFTKAFPQNTATALRYWELAAQQGSCQSLINLSSVYDRGVGVSADQQKGADYVKQAARCKPDNSFYLWKLGSRFYNAMGVAQDCEAAEKLFRQSLDHGYADAAADLGYIYDKGCGPIARDDQRAFQIYLLGAKLGVPLCQNNVGAMLKHGRGVKDADPARGYGWIKLAALQGDELANNNLQDPLFTPGVRAVGLAHLADIQRRLLAIPADPLAITSDPWY